MKYTTILSTMIFLACNKSTSIPPEGGLPPIVIPSVDLAVCILEHAATDPACKTTGGNALLCADDLANACGSDAQNVTRVLTASKHANDAGVR